MKKAPLDCNPPVHRKILKKIISEKGKKSNEEELRHKGRQGGEPCNNEHFVFAVGIQHHIQCRSAACTADVRIGGVFAWDRVHRAGALWRA